MDLRELTKQWIEAHGTKKSWLANNLNCSIQHVSYWLNNEREMSQQKLELLKAIVLTK